MLIAFAAVAAGPKVSDDGWTLDASVECGNASIIEDAGPDRFIVAPREDPVPIEVQKTGPISNYVVYLEIDNRKAESRQITVDVLIPEWLIRDKFDYFLRKPFLVRSRDRLDYRVIDADSQIDLPDRTRLRIDFAPRERKILSTIAAYPYSLMRRRLEEIEKNSQGRARIRTIGRSLQNRPILSLETGDKSKPRAVFLATLQPGEPSAWALLAMAEAVLIDPELMRFQKEYDLAFIPMPNPDGVVNGAANVNSRGEIVLLGFEAASQGEPGFHEAQVVWGYLNARPPSVLIDFHFLTLPNHPVPRPYVFAPSLYSDPERGRMGASLVRRLERLSEAPEGPEIPQDHPMWKKLVTYQAIRKWNTVATLYQNTGPLTSYEQAQKRGVEVLRVALDPNYPQ